MQPRGVIGRLKVNLMTSLKAWAEALKHEVMALISAIGDPAVTWPARILSIAIIAYAVSPIDLIPDFIPVIGYLDDLILIPLAIALVVRLIPAEVLETHRTRALTMTIPPRLKIAGAVFVVAMWIIAGWWMLSWFWMTA